MDAKFLIENVCKQTGVSMRNLAQLVGVQQSNISRYQYGQRDLPATVLLQLLHFFQRSKTLAAPAVATCDAAQSARMQRQAARCLAACRPLQKKLTIAQDAFKQATSLLLWLEDMENTMPEMPAETKSWIAGQRYAAKNKLVRYSWEVQHELSVKISLLQHEAALYQETFPKHPVPILSEAG